MRPNDLTFRTLVPCALLLGTSASASAQTTRYRDPSFTTATITRDLAYGSALNRFTNLVETLRLDVHEPAGDTASARPAIVVVHGGGFVGGNKGQATMTNLAFVFVQRGYVAISINYRLAPANTPITRQVVTDASEDCKAAIRWLRRNAATWRIDTERIASVGSSAGAYTVLEAAYVAGEGNSGNPGYRSDVQCTIDLWGRLMDLGTLEAGEVPVCIIHGTDDATVPYINATTLDRRATAVNVPHELHPLTGAGHAPWNLMPQFEPDMVAFCYEHLKLAQLSGLTARPGYASPGTLTLDHFGVAGDLVLTLLGAQEVAIPLPGLGTLCIDPVASLVLPLLTLPQTPRLPTTAQSLPVPAGLGGATLYWQAVQIAVGTPRTLTGCVRTRF